MNIRVINGPNLNMLGVREPGIYGKETYKDLVDKIEKYAREINVDVKCYQSNHEGDIVDVIQFALGIYDGIVEIWILSHSVEAYGRKHQN